MKKLTLLFISVLTALSVYAKDVNVSGTVVADTDDEPLIGASVMVKGTSIGVATDLDGFFTLKVPQG
ncbi:MAG: carboxypeptidase-like regulatory domain-containing protein, partial [Muribaculaceae bacterium]|nr:carboxypeptidase-like regulatory domain-containing protein [Muribaculaceae bacterium]